MCHSAHEAGLAGVGHAPFQAAVHLAVDVAVLAGVAHGEHVYAGIDQEAFLLKGPALAAHEGVALQHGHRQALLLQKRGDSGATGPVPITSTFFALAIFSLSFSLQKHSAGMSLR